MNFNSIDKMYSKSSLGYLRVLGLLYKSSTQSCFGVNTLIDLNNFKSVQTPVLNIGYGDYGDVAGFPIMLLHGFPYEVLSFDGVVKPLVDAGYRVLVPYLRGYGTTSFINPSAPRMAEQAAIGQDVTDFADALGIGQFATAGYDWGNRAACITSILHPDRVKAQVAIGGYSVQDTVNTEKPSAAVREAQLWYQWYFNSPQGIAGLTENRRDVVKYLWDTWAPKWNYTDDAFSRAASAFDNPDFVDIVIHSYRHRHKNAPGEDRFLEVERQLAEQPKITVPSIVLLAGDSGFGRPSEDPSRDEDRFPSLVARRIVEGAGHDVPTPRPDAVADALIELLKD